MDGTAQQSPEIGSTYKVENDPSGRAKCKMCSQKIACGSIRMGKLSIFSAGYKNHQRLGYQYYHIDCLFKRLKACRLTTKVLDNSDDVENFESIPEESKVQIRNGIKTLKDHREKVKADLLKIEANYQESKCLPTPLHCQEKFLFHHHVLKNYVSYIQMLMS